MEEVEVTLYLTKWRAQALAQFACRIDQVILSGYVVQEQRSLTEQALEELREALSDAGFRPR